MGNRHVYGHVANIRSCQCSQSGYFLCITRERESSCETRSASIGPAKGTQHWWDNVTHSMDIYSIFRNE